MEDVPEATGAVVAADVVVAVVVTGQLLVLPLRALVHVCRAGRASYNPLTRDGEESSRHSQALGGAAHSVGRYLHSLMEASPKPPVTSEETCPRSQAAWAAWATSLLVVPLFSDSCDDSEQDGYDPLLWMEQRRLRAIKEFTPRHTDSKCSPLSNQGGLALKSGF